MFVLVLLLILLLRPSEAANKTLGICNFKNPPPLTCNVTTYQQWRGCTYSGPLATDPNFWMYQTKKRFVLTNGLALDLVVTKCQDRFKNLYTFKAGRSGPIKIQDGFKSICSNVCLESDRLSQEALTRSSCSCKEISTQPGNPYYKVEGDYCRHNSARMMCDIIGYCGIWNCRIDDFMCPRYEFNKRNIFLKRLGTCKNGASSSRWLSVSVMLISLISIVTWLIF